MFEEFEFGNYKLLKKLAASASSEIFLGIPKAGPKAGRLVVIKKLLPEIARTDIFAELLKNEARLGKNMNHPNVVKIYECGTHGAELFLTMEYVDGLDLWRCMRRIKKTNMHVSRIQALYITAEVLKALQYLHNLRDESGNRIGVVHHDVSPSNILISRIGEVKIGDFGISFSKHKDLPDSERKIRFRGKVHYISPEQVKGQEADSRSDIFSVGVVLAELLIGKKPFEGPTDLSILINIKDGRSRLISDTADNLPKPVNSIMMHAIANHPDERFQTAGEMLSAIEQYAGVDKLFDAGIKLGELVNTLKRDVDKTPPPRPAPLFVPKQDAFQNEKSIPPVVNELPSGLYGGRGVEEVTGSEQTPMLAVKEYLVKKADGQLLGTMAMSVIIENIIADRLSEDDLISIGGKPFQPVGVISDFAKHLPSITPTTKIHDLGQPDRRGIIGEEESVSKVFLQFYRKKDTGLIIFECASVRKEIFVEEGSPSYASSNLAGELLGEFLVKKEFINRMELELALAMMDRFSGHLGDTLIGLDIMDSITLLNAITEQIKTRIYDLYTWDSGSFSFYTNAKYMKEGFKLAADPLELIRDGFLFSRVEDEINEWYEYNKTRLFHLTENVNVIDEWKIEVPHRTILSKLEKPHPLFEIVEGNTMLDDEGVYRLKKLFRLGIEIGFIKEIA